MPKTAKSAKKAQSKPKKAQSKLEAWEGPTSKVCTEVEHQARANLDAYRVNPPLLKEQANNERAAFQGGYAQRQLYELIQNGADALLGSGGGRVEVVLTDDAFYCANGGEPINVPGAQAILLAHVSQKRGDEIGRFGLGFKSVLEVTDSPEFYSRSGSFVWDYPRALDEIAEAVSSFKPGKSLAPRLRIAYPVEPEASFSNDAILADLASWATTIVKLPLKGQFEWLAKDIATFPREFLLFCGHVGQLALDNRSSLTFEDDEQAPLPMQRVIEVAREGDEFHLREGSDDSTWVLFSTVYSPSKAAQHDAGEMTNRQRVPIHWALPLEGRTGPGVLWAFFPTEYETTLSGIVNAPWKTTSERRNLLEGVFNEELLSVVAQLVVNNLGSLPLADDPGRLLDIIPARGREARNWADRVLTDGVYELAARADSLPDLDGSLRRPGDLSLHPALRRPGEEADADVAERLLERWASAAADRDWCHWSVERRERRPRVERLIRESGGVLAGWREWLEALVEKPSVDASRAALLIAAESVDEGLVPRTQVEAAEIVFTRDGRMVDVDPHTVFLPSEYEGADEVDFVHDELAADPDVRSALERLGIEPVDAAADLDAFVRGGMSGRLDSEWQGFWDVARRIEPERAAGVLKARNRTPFVRVSSGKFRPLHSTLLPGAIIPEDAARDRDTLIDTRFHQADLELLRLLGGVAAPQAGLGSEYEPWFDAYYGVTLAEYRTRITSGRRPRQQLLGFDRSDFAGPLTALESLSDEGRMLFTEAALAAEGDLEPWEFFHSTNRDGYPIMTVDPPVLWRVREEGRLRTTQGPQPVAKTVSQQLAEWGEVLPVAEISEELAVRLGVPDSLDQIGDEVWKAALLNADHVSDDGVLGRFYVEASRRLDDAPDHLRCRIGDGFGPALPSLVSVVHDRRELTALIPQKVPTLLVASAADAQNLQVRWGLNTEQKVETSIAYAASAEPAPLFDCFPALQWQVEDDAPSLMLVPCEQLRLETSTDAGQDTEDVDFYVDEGNVYYDQSLEPSDLLDRLAPVVGFSADTEVVEEIITRGAEAARRKRTASVRRQRSEAARLVAAVGDSGLRSRLPKGLLAVLEADGARVEGKSVGELALAVYGIDALRAYRSELRDQGLDPPTQWAGSPAALSFVRRLGFPREYAGFEQPGRSPLLEVEGPPDVPDLHPYQQLIVDEFRRLLRGEGKGRRALMSLPTGAGKTRVAVEAIIEALEADELKGPVLWIAQSDELCEQAVQTWSFVWRGEGPSRERLAISRLWAANEAEPVESGHQVVVATIQKLGAGCYDDPDYEWLSNAGCVVIDEAHHSTARSYSALLRWQGLGRGKDSRPLVGLTATPFRGTSEEEGKRLVRRYGGRRLDLPAFGEHDPYPILQKEGILAEVKHRILGGSEIELTEDELRKLKQTRLLPRSAEERLGLDAGRNERLLNEIERLPDDWTILVFATSVDHAQTMAALLTRDGIPSKPITGLTDAGPRRHYIEEFRAGRLRVLTNYAVLTQGFDAPAVRAIFVARPTYSPNLYQQMIGRGLRGPLNGGKDVCLIVNVEDNVAQYGENLAFRDFEYLWNGAGGAERDQ